MEKKWLIGFLIVFLAAFGFLAWSSRNQIASNQSVGQGAVVTEVKADDWQKGNKEAKVFLIEYGDFQCPACAAYLPFVQRLTKDFPEELAVIYRHFPLTSIHPKGLPAARAAEAAGLQNKFWEMHDILFERQDEWVVDEQIKERFGSYALELGLDKDKFLIDFDSQEVETKVSEDLSSANNLKLNATPTFFINGRRVINLPTSYEELKALVEKELSGK